jgi:hypothetical protein
MTPKHKQFIAEYVKDLHGADAYRRVYGADCKSPDSAAARLMAREDIKSAIEVALEDKRARTGWTAEKLVANFETVYARSLEAEEYTAACRALEMIGKVNDLFAEKVRLEHSGKVHHTWVVVRADEENESNGQ